MKKLICILSIICFFAITNVYASYQYYDIYWDQSTETSNYWNFNLTTFNNHNTITYGVYDSLIGLDSAIILNSGDNNLHITDNLNFFTETKHQTNTYMLLDADDYSVSIYSNNKKLATITMTPIAPPTGQPLPGIFASIIVGGILCGSKKIMKKAKNA